MRMPKERRDWILDYRFKDFYANESAWESDFKKFCAELKRFDSEHKQVEGAKS